LQQKQLFEDERERERRERERDLLGGRERRLTFIRLLSLSKNRRRRGEERRPSRLQSYLGERESSPAAFAASAVREMFEEHVRRVHEREERENLYYSDDDDDDIIRENGFASKERERLTAAEVASSRGSHSGGGCSCSSASVPKSSFTFLIDETTYCVPVDFQHPGGKEWLRKFDGKDISKLFAEEDYNREESDARKDRRSRSRRSSRNIHRHSSSARKLLQKFAVGDLKVSQEAREDKSPSPADKEGEKESLQIDFGKPMVFQVGKLEEKYQEWVHRPELGKPRFFKSEFCEQLSKTNWWVVPIVWIPVIIYCYWMSLQRCEGNARCEGKLLACFVFGTLFWSLVEYSVHRFLFHVNTSSYWWNTFHFIFHGCHHKFPMDDMRLVMPPAGALPIVFMVYAVEFLMLGYELAPVTLAGTLSGYVVYDMIHYHCHFSEFTNKYDWLRSIRSSHMDHHYRDFTRGFGISTNTWDVILNTNRRRKA